MRDGQGGVQHMKGAGEKRDESDESESMAAAMRMRPTAAKLCRGHSRIKSPERIR